jgi:sialate O-acetylesterase
MKPLLPPFFSDGMVIQRDSTTPIRGYAEPGASLAVKLRGESGAAAAVFSPASAVADGEGRWETALPPAPPGGPYTIEISSPGAEPALIKDLWVGDLWLCAGQSNMELSMERLKDEYPEEWNPQINSQIRQFKAPREWDFGGPRNEYGGGCWQAAAPETLAAFSGAPWFFARTLYEKYRLPIGLINTAMGGTPIEAWMGGEALKDFPRQAERGRLFAGADYRRAREEESLAPFRAWHDRAREEDSGLREGWYREETDDSAWGELGLPGDFANSGAAGGKAGDPIPEDFCGIIWFRKTLRLPAAFAGKRARIWLGTIVDADTLYINGRELGNTAYRYPPRKYSLPAGVLREGENHIALRVLCCRGGGQVTPGKPFRIFTEGAALELAGTWKYRAGLRLPACPEPFFIQGEPSGLYNAMIAPVIRQPLKGIIWYQGESNADTDGGVKDYAAHFAALIGDWREKSGRGNIPFLFVQLPLFGRPGENTVKSRWAAIREVQAAALSLPATGMATALDLGEWNDLHPLDKKGVGRRLALAAMGAAYGENNSAPGPLFRGLHREGDTLILEFDRCGGGLRARGGLYVTVLAGNGAFRREAAMGGKDCLLVNIGGIPKPDTLLYAWADNPADRGLYNSDGLPAAPFKAPL